MPGRPPSAFLGSGEGALQVTGVRHEPDHPHWGGPKLLVRRHLRVDAGMDPRKDPLGQEVPVLEFGNERALGKGPLKLVAQVDHQRVAHPLHERLPSDRELLVAQALGRRERASGAVHFGKGAEWVPIERGADAPQAFVRVPVLVVAAETYVVTREVAPSVQERHLAHQGLAAALGERRWPADPVLLATLMQMVVGILEPVLGLARPGTLAKRSERLPRRKFGEGDAVPFAERFEGGKAVRPVRALGPLEQPCRDPQAGLAQADLDLGRRPAELVGSDALAQDGSEILDELGRVALGSLWIAQPAPEMRGVLDTRPAPGLAQRLFGGPQLFRAHGVGTKERGHLFEGDPMGGIEPAEARGAETCVHLGEKRVLAEPAPSLTLKLGKLVLGNTQPRQEIEPVLRLQVRVKGAGGIPRPLPKDGQAVGIRGVPQPAKQVLQATGLTGFLRLVSARLQGGIFLEREPDLRGQHQVPVEKEVERHERVALPLAGTGEGVEGEGDETGGDGRRHAGPPGVKRTPANPSPTGRTVRRIRRTLSSLTHFVNRIFTHLATRRPDKHDDASRSPPRAPIHRRPCGESRSAATRTKVEQGNKNAPQEGGTRRSQPFRPVGDEGRFGMPFGVDIDRGEEAEPKVRGNGTTGRGQGPVDPPAAQAGADEGGERDPMPRHPEVDRPVGRFGLVEPGPLGRVFGTVRRRRGTPEDERREPEAAEQRA